MDPAPKRGTLERLSRKEEDKENTKRTSLEHGAESIEAQDRKGVKPQWNRLTPRLNRRRFKGASEKDELKL
jgi:hypothetical protein